MITTWGSDIHRTEQTPCQAAASRAQLGRHQARGRSSPPTRERRSTARRRCAARGVRFLWNHDVLRLIRTGEADVNDRSDAITPTSGAEFYGLWVR